jgi:hypothetical protein
MKLHISLSAGNPSPQQQRAFLNAYLKAALWSSNDSEGEPLDKNYEVKNFDRQTVNQLRTNCLKFLQQAGSIIIGEGDNIDTFAKAGHDFWLTHNGHGAGFWDGDWGDVGDELTKKCKRYRQVDLYVGDDGKIYS